MPIMTKIIAASSAVTALAVGGAIALAVSGASAPASAETGPTITASATGITQPATTSPSPSSSAGTSGSAAPAPALPVEAPAAAAAPAAPAAAPAAVADATRVTQQQAIDIAMARAPGASIDRVRMEPEHGSLVWKVDLFAAGTEYEFRIDAGSGAVVRAEVDGDGGSGHSGDHDVDDNHDADDDHDDDHDDD